MNQKTKIQTFFTDNLLDWAADNLRTHLPWVQEKDPYLIWLSEIILQQTRVEQGLAYFLKFKEKYPNIIDLAKAPEDEVMKLWEGLGYYSRARNMHKTAKIIKDDFGGNFPNDYKDILALKGVGEYTAAAIASFAFDLPYPVLDGNVYRVLSRYFGIDTPINTTPAKKEFNLILSKVFKAKKAAFFNQAIMDFGSMQCKPKNPNCLECPLVKNCFAFQRKMVHLLPVKKALAKKKIRFFNVFVFKTQKGSTFIQKREGKDIWLHLHQFPLVESDEFLSRKKISSILDSSYTKYKVLRMAGPYKTVLTHQLIHAVFWEISIHSEQGPKGFPGAFKCSQKDLSSYAFPKLIHCYLQDKSIYLELI